MKCNWCGSSGECEDGCQCIKCVDPEGYKNWKFNSDGTFTEAYKNWALKEREKYANIPQIQKYQRSDDLFYDCVIEELKNSNCNNCENKKNNIIKIFFGPGHEAYYCLNCIEISFFNQYENMGTSQEKYPCIYCKTLTDSFVTYILRNGGGGCVLCNDCLKQIRKRISVILENHEKELPLTRIPSRSNVGDFFWN